MKRKILVFCMLTALLLSGCGSKEDKQTVIDVTNAYSQMYYDNWQDLLGKAESDTTYEFENGFEYYKVKDGLITLQQMKEQTEQICTQDFAKEEFYESLLESEAPLLFDYNGELYVKIAEMPGLNIGEIEKVNILEKEEDYIRAEIHGEDYTVGGTVTNIAILKENGMWKVDSLTTTVEN